MDLAKLIRDVPDFPKKGILFKDISTLLADPAGFRLAVGRMARSVREMKVDKIAAIEARGFFFGGALALKLGCGLAPVRKAGKLPWRTIREEYALEYGTAAVEAHEDAVSRGERVLVVDDLLATGGTALAAVRLVERLGGTVCGVSFLVELLFLAGRDRLKGYDVRSVLQF